jgi:Putative transposase
LSGNDRYLIWFLICRETTSFGKLAVGCVRSRSARTDGSDLPSALVTNAARRRGLSRAVHVQLAAVGNADGQYAHLIVDQTVVEARTGTVARHACREVRERQSNSAEAKESHAVDLPHRGGRQGRFSLHVGVDIVPNRHRNLDRLCRRVSRPSVAGERLKLTALTEVG